MDIKKISFKNKASLDLCGISICSREKSDIALVVCHGFSGSKEGGGKSIDMAKYFASYKITTLLFDFSGNGESQGRFCDITLTNQVNDVDAAIQYISSLTYNKIFLMGRSFGGSTVICYQGSHKRKDISGVIGINSVARPYDLFCNFISKQDGERITLKSDQGELIVNKNFFNDLKKWNILEMAQNISPTPLLIIHGEMDELVEVKQGISIFDHAREPKKLKIIKGGDHTLSQGYEKMWEISLNFMLENSK